MNPPAPSPRADDGPDDHATDEALSASLDGHTAPGLPGHIAGCARCQARLTALASARHAVAASPARAPERVRDDALAAARQAWSGARGGSPGSAAITTLAVRRRPSRRVALGAAAAVVVALLAVPALLDSNGRQPVDSASAPSSARQEAADQEGGAPTELAQSGRESANRHPDLGDQSDVAAVGRTVLTTLAPRPAPALASPGPDALDSAEGRSAPGEAAPPSLAAGPDIEPPACDAPVRARSGVSGTDELGVLVYSATLRYRGADALALAYQQGDEPSYRLFIVASQGCRLLDVANL